MSSPSEHKVTRRHPAARLAVIGVGHELRGDDAAGAQVARRLAPYAWERLLVIDAGSAPENFSGVVRRFSPTGVLFVDVAQMDEPPGTVRWLTEDEIAGLSASTHTLPLRLLARYLQEHVNCQVYLIGIQPARDGLDDALSPEVTAAVNGVASGIRAVFAWT
ncbi:MAG TPA: hydrogenase maturation peptidase HycI [Candidatus Sulfomarinibacteraceae bacterium]|nr:hydrogenase maturation peptidase HycI [Candidatus Sulfomarinibacteraceae bacterium]